MEDIIINKNLFNKGVVGKVKHEVEKVNRINNKDKQVCTRCKNDSFKVYISVIIDDAVLVCAKCNKPNNKN